MNALKFLLKFLVLISLFFSYPVIAAKWTWRNPLLPENTLRSVSCPTENFCVAVGYYPTVFTSTDKGINWTQQSAGTNNSLYSISCPTETLCVAVGYSGTVLTSTDGGISWTLRSSGTSNRLYNISCPTETLCVAVGDDGTVLTSTDKGINWTQQSAGTTNSLYSISCPTENLCVAIGYPGTILTSTDKGINWTQQSAGTNNSLYSNSISCPTENLCVAVGYKGTVWTSTDKGINWTLQSSGTTNQLSGISCPTETFCVAVGNSGTVLTSTDKGINWTLQSTGANNWLSGINCLNHGCIVVGSWGSILTNNTQPLVEADINPLSGKIGDTFTLNLADYFEDSEDGDNLTYAILGNYTVVEFDQSQLPQLKLTLVAGGSEEVTLRVTDSQGWSIKYAFKVAVESVSVACEPAIYSNQTDQAYLPAVEMPFFTRIDGKAVNLIGLYSALLEMPFGFSDFEVKELTFIQTTATSDPCHAIFTPDTGTLTIPFLEVTAVTRYLSPQLIEGPVLTCSATLQQSVLKPEVLSLIKYACDLPV
ncbi:hypothetical protein THII_3523 [Thioploca ingrica]|uniref:Photosynthesis system II assembly factor Ycf48/Hcf136-like domain-containing protein n=1 Tax=Thioploca ingrica TaxID=40754 RepID=A0A090AQE3_9GAMM|nr:hypothetical protein THII_3523 [Thioploca ingrica]